MGAITPIQFSSSQVQLPLVRLHICPFRPLSHSVTILFATCPIHATKPANSDNMRRCLPVSLKTAQALRPQPVFEKFVQSLPPISVDGPVTTTHLGGMRRSPRQPLSGPESPSLRAQRPREKKSFKSQTIASRLDEVRQCACKSLNWVDLNSCMWTCRHGL